MTKALIRGISGQGRPLERIATGTLNLLEAIRFLGRPKRWHRRMLRRHRRPARRRDNHHIGTATPETRMHTDPLLYRLFQERPALAIALSGLSVPAAAAYRWQAIEVKQIAFRLDGVLWPPPEREDAPLVFVEAQFQGRKTLPLGRGQDPPTLKPPDDPLPTGRREFQP